MTAAVRIEWRNSLDSFTREIAHFDGCEARIDQINPKEYRVWSRADQLGRQRFRTGICKDEAEAKQQAEQHLIQLAGETP